MSLFTAKSSKVYLGGFDVSGDLNAVALDYSADAVDQTTFGKTTRCRLGGLKGVAMSCQGLWEAGANPDKIDHIIWDNFATADVPVTVVPQTGALAETAYFFRALLAKYSINGQQGAALPFSASGEASQGPLVRGSVMIAAGNKTSTASGTAYQLGAVSATQSVYAVLHVLSVSGTNPTLDVILESDNAQGFSSGITKITFAQKTAIGSQFATPVAGAITDDWWRIGYTIGGTDTPTFSFMVAVGIQTTALT